MSKPFLGKGVGFPVTVENNGALAQAAHEESIRQSVWIILGTAKGERVMRPDFGCGIYDLVFEVNSLPLLGRCLKLYERRCFCLNHVLTYWMCR